MSTLQRTVALGAFIIFNLPSHADAADSASLEFAGSNKTQILRIGTQWLWNEKWWQSNDTHIGGYWDLMLAQWREQNYQGITDAQHNLTSVGITPVFRFQHDRKMGFYAEAGIGLHWLSANYNNNGHTLTGNVQFGDHIGIGYVVNNWDMGFKYQHFSNAGIQQPNGGVNFAVLKIGHSF